MSRRDGSAVFRHRQQRALRWPTGDEESHQRASTSRVAAGRADRDRRRPAGLRVDRTSARVLRQEASMMRRVNAMVDAPLALGDSPATPARIDPSTARPRSRRCRRRPPRAIGVRDPAHQQQPDRDDADQLRLPWGTLLCRARPRWCIPRGDRSGGNPVAYEHMVRGGPWFGANARDANGLFTGGDRHHRRQPGIRRWRDRMDADRQERGVAPSDPAHQPDSVPRR
jgi:hypothetical protein